jgi:hypothetical protein
MDDRPIGTIAILIHRFPIAKGTATRLEEYARIGSAALANGAACDKDAPEDAYLFAPLPFWADHQWACSAIVSLDCCLLDFLVCKRGQFHALRAGEHDNHIRDDHGT